MNSFSTLIVSLVLLLSVQNLRAVCPVGSLTAGVCVGSLCIPGYYCNVNADGTNECCSGTQPVSNNCYDALQRCAEWNSQGYCANAFYTVAMKNETCRKTCGYC